ncbi:hypothetical protein RirG_068750 [Rhizophagus irregularis DAOM 197198w]|uniref:Uncharacterized protein n=1 Tax=Rhizophagus irregularis (strain DAOM 197198w) TaxID=1432141 RepID=A0A015N0C0_RHIIW|nr:hypothetical protein RirG_068750 [Rhizophagus irregularis DAOM 197198w]
MYNFVISFRTTSGGDVFINDPSVFLRRAPPPDCESTTTVSDRLYVLAEESVDTVVYPLTPAHE